MKEEQKNKIRDSLKLAYFTGRRKKRVGWKHTDEAIKKISDASKRAIWDEKRRLAVSNAVKGKKRSSLSEAHKRKLSEALRGRVLSEQHLEKLRCNLIGARQRGSELRKVGLIGPPFKHQSAEVKEKVRNSWTGGMRLKQAMLMAKRLHAKGSSTDLEMAVERLLNKCGVEFEAQFIADGVFVFDFKIRGILIECDGEYWHLMPRNKMQDEKKTLWAKENGFVLVRFSDNEFKEDLFEKKINDVLKGVDLGA